MFGSIKYNLAHLLDFNGRDARQTFWYYVLFLVILQFVFGLVIAVPLMVGIFGNIFEAAQSGATDQQAINNLMAAQMGDWTQSIVPYSLAISAVMIVLFVAAFVRRLHDSGKSGWWAALPVATQLVSIWVSYSTLGKMQQLMVSAMQNPQAGMQYQREMVPFSLLPWIGYIVVIVFGIMKSTDGPNRYGEAPVSF